MNWGPIQIVEITWFLSKAHKWKSLGSDHIQNYWILLRGMDWVFKSDRVSSL